MNTTSNIIDGKAIGAQIKGEIKAEIEALKARGVTPGLATLLVGDNPASQVYVKNKHKACQEIGMASFNHTMPKEATQAEVLKKIDSLNNDQAVHGILVQLPLPPQINSDDVLQAVRPDKDADGFHPFNLGRMFSAKDYNQLITPASKSGPGQGSLVALPLPCTPWGCIELLERSNILIAGKNAVVVGRSVIVGKPMAMLLLSKNATVTVAHSQTKDLPAVCRQADILVAAIGRAKMITADYVKEGAAVIDVGMNRLPDGKLCGDMDYDGVKDKAGWITPVPGGVGPMTITMLLKNTVQLAKR